MVLRWLGLFLCIDTETGLEKMDALEDEREFPTSEIERNITSPDSNQKIVEELRKFCDQHEQEFKRFPKTLIFVANDLPHTSHADQLVNICRDVFGRGDAFVQKITGRVDRRLQRIREFRNRPNPGIVVSVDMLSTGVDIPDLEFIVMLRPVKSRILFEQMLGRGTRKGERFPDKSHFTVFDCFDGTLLEYFAELEKCYGADPNGRAKRKESERFHKFSIAEVKAKDFKLDGFKWLKDEDIEDSDELPEPEELATNAIAALEGAVVELRGFIAALETAGKSA